MHVIHIYNAAFYLSLYSLNFFEGRSLKVLNKIVYEPSHGIESQTNKRVQRYYLGIYLFIILSIIIFLVMIPNN